MRSVHGFVSGRVQGVSYRASFRQAAQRNQVKGWVRNLRDGRVEFWVEGAADAVQRQLDWARRGPSAALVSGVSVAAAEPQGFTACEVRYDG